MTLTGLAHRLTQYDEQEARSIVRVMLEDCCGWKYTDICCGVLESLSEEDRAKLESLMKRLEDGEPVQYVTGKAEFYGRTFYVESGVLIPRPETEMLVEIINAALGYTNVHECTTNVSRNFLRILDIGTGSGCIAVTLAMEIPGAEVTAWDISEEALRIAKGNAERLGADVKFIKQNALNPPEVSDYYDIIVSNPPYICDKEAVEMEQNVLEHEPRIALFVPDDDPLLFYKKITAFASKALKEDGILAFEINPLHAEELRELVSGFKSLVSGGFSGFQEVTIHQDQYGKARCLLARKRIHAEGQNE